MPYLWYDKLFRFIRKHAYQWAYLFLQCNYLVSSWISFTFIMIKLFFLFMKVLVYVKTMPTLFLKIHSMLYSWPRFFTFKVETDKMINGRQLSWSHVKKSKQKIRFLLLTDSQTCQALIQGVNLKCLRYCHERNFDHYVKKCACFSGDFHLRKK